MNVRLNDGAVTADRPPRLDLLRERIRDDEPVDLLPRRGCHALDVSLQRRLGRRRRRQRHPAKGSHAARVGEQERELLVAAAEPLLGDQRAKNLLRGHRFAPRIGPPADAHQIAMHQPDRARQSVKHGAHHRELAGSDMVGGSGDKTELLGYFSTHRSSWFSRWVWRFTEKTRAPMLLFPCATQIFPCDSAHFWFWDEN